MPNLRPLRGFAEEEAMTATRPWTLPAEKEFANAFDHFGEFLCALDDFETRMRVDLSGFVAIDAWLG
jgi:hypothetical protein